MARPAACARFYTAAKRMQSVSKHMRNGHKGVENFSLQKAFIFEQLSF